MNDSIKIHQVLIFAVIALIWHFLIFIAPWQQLDSLPFNSIPKRLSITPINTPKLEALRHEWRKRAFLLSKGPKKKVPAPDFARYFSNQNRVVPKETRARNTDAIPKPGASSKVSNLGMQMLHSTTLPDSIKPSENNYSKTNKRITQIKTNRIQGPSASIGMDQSIIDPTLPEGQQNLLNTRESVHYSFFSRVYLGIVPLWQDRIRSTRINRPLIPKDYIARVKITLDQEGYVKSIDFLNSSGVSEFDQAFTFAWKKLNRFPNPPKELLKNGKLEMGWTIAVTVRNPYDFGSPPQ